MYSLFGAREPYEHSCGNPSKSSKFRGGWLENDRFIRKPLKGGLKVCFTAGAKLEITKSKVIISI